MNIETQEKPLISVVTPVYNGEKFVRQAYDCLCRQSYDRWEWVVVNDGSTDQTDHLIQALLNTDKRISYFWQRNSGTPKYARDRAVYESKGELVVMLDIDDQLSDDYLLTMLQRLLATEADIVYPKMVFVDTSTGQHTQTLPTADVDTDSVYCGRDLVKFTMPEWRIGCNGGLYRKPAWLNLSYPVKTPRLCIYSDEVDERIYQIHARRVAFAPAQYFYQNHPVSITTKISAKSFDLLIADLQLADIIEQTFDAESEEVTRLHQKLYYNWRSQMASYARNYKNLLTARDAIEQHLRQVFQRINPTCLSKNERRKLLGLKSYPLVFALFCLKYGPKLLGEKLMQRCMPSLYRWTVIRHRTEQQLQQQLTTFYNEAPITDCQPFVVMPFCNHVAHGGLVDRLRGIVSVYQICQSTGRTFKLLFDYPFPLTDYLRPAHYDWQVEACQVSFNRTQTDTLVLDTQTNRQWELNRQRSFLKKHIGRHQSKQLHCYTNSPIAYEADFGPCFNRLFKPSELLRAHLEAIQEEIQGAYITVSARFCNLLGDFNEEVYSEPLEPEAQRQLLDECVAQTLQLGKKHPEKRIVACSDSGTFLHNLQERLPSVYVIPGTVSHIGNDVAHNYEYYEKTFLDFFTIARAASVYLLCGNGMYQSGFPYAASLLEQKPYTIITF